MKPYLFLVIILVLFVNPASAQMHIVLAGKSYQVPAFNATNDTPAIPQDLKIDSEYMSYNIIPPLSSSPNQLEVRCSNIGANTNNYLVTIIKCNKDSLWWEQYRFYKRRGKASNATKYIQLSKSGTNALPYYLSVFIKKNAIAVKSYPVIDTLIHLGLFTEPSMETILARLKSKGVQLQQPGIMDCCGDEIFTIKLNNHYRRFIYNGYMPMGNPDIKELADAAKLVNTFYYIASDS